MDSLFEIPGVGQPAPGATSGAVPGSGSLGANTHASAPLAVRMRPRTIDELVGQQQLRAAGSPLRRLIEGDQSMSLLLWGPPGTGKTTIAAIVSQQTRRRFVEVSAVAAGVKEVRAAIDGARAELARGGQETVLAGGGGQLGEPGSEHEAALHVAGHQAVVLERHGEPVGGRPGEPGAGHQTGKGGRPGLEGGEHEGGLVENADSA